MFGREPELLELVDTTIADRIVLLHSPSGAGKTSLLQAGLIPRLRAKGFFFNELGKLLRDEKGLWAIFAIREDYLGELSPLAFRIPTRLSNLYRLTLLGPDEAAEAVVGPALEVGVVFEEDAARQLVDNLRKVRGTASDEGTPRGPFVEPVQLQVVCLWLWEKLADAATGTDPDPGRITLDDLRVLGDVVDDALAGYYTTRVTEVAQQTASGFPTPAQAERAIREWFSYRLISAKGVRQPVSKEQSGLPDVAVRGLRDAYLVREDRRGSFTWIELAHDRLVAPVTHSNETWFKERLSKFQIRLALWIGQDRPDNLLLSGPDLNEGEHWAFANPDKLDDDGRDLLSRSKKRLTGGDAWTYRLLKYLRWAAMTLVGVFAVGCVVLGLLLLYSIEQRNLLKRKTDEILKNEQSLKESNDRIKEKSTEITNQNKKIQAKLEEEIKAASQLEDTAFRARLGQIASRSLLLLPEQPDLSLLLGVEAVRRINERDLQRHSVSAFDPTSGRARVVAFNALLGALQHTPEATAFFYPQAGEVAAVAVRPDGRRAATGNRSGNLVVTDLSERRSVLGPLRLHPHPNGAACVACSHDGKTIATGGFDGTVAVVNAETGKQSTRFKPGEVVGSVTFVGGDKQVLYSAGTKVYRGTVADGMTAEFARSETRRIINAFAVSPDGRRIATAGFTGQVRFWDLDSGKEESGAAFSISQNVTALAFCPGEPRLLAVGVGGTVATASETKMQQQQQSRAEAPDMSVNQVLIWDVTTRRRVGLPLIGHAAEVTGLAFSPDGCTLALGDPAGMVALFGPGETKPFRESRRHLGAVRSLAFGNYGRFLASGGDDNAVVFWDLLHPDAPPEPQSVHRGSVGCLAFDPFGLMLASGGDDGTIVFWDGRTGLPLGPAFIAHGGVSALAFLPDGKRLLSGGRFGIVRSWDVDPDSWVKMACAVANRNLSQREWKEKFEDEDYRSTCPDLPGAGPAGPIAAAPPYRPGPGDAMTSQGHGVSPTVLDGLEWLDGKAMASVVETTESPKGHSPAAKKSAGHDIDIRERASLRAPQSSYAAPLGETPAKGPALLLASRWMPGQTIRVRFLDGSPEDHAKVHRWAEEWTREANLIFDWSDTPLATVRITFDPPENNWSYLGTNCLLAPRGDPTMCLGVINSLQERAARRVVLFEFGHALGFVTELKKPDVGITWNTEAVLDDFGKKRWSTGMVYEQLINPSPAGTLGLNTKFDPDSIMTFAIKKEWTLNGVEIHENFDLSDGDKAAARAAYPGGRNVPWRGRLRSRLHAEIGR
ncbi:MAG: hypothetical protein ACHRXM_11195 [Isosphaerales bacterium]